MRAQGMGGVEVNLVWRVYAKGDIPLISPEWFAMVRHAITEAARLDMELAIAFASGWSLGGSWVEVTDRSNVLGPAWVDLPWSMLRRTTTCRPPVPSAPGPVVSTHSQAPSSVLTM